MTNTNLEIIVPEDFSGIRIDNFLSENIGESVSRTFVQKLIKNGQVKVNGTVIKKTAFLLDDHQQILIDFPEVEPMGDIEAEDIPLDILYEDEDALVISKPAGMCVHPDHAYTSGTVVNAILYHCKDSLSGIGGVTRPGIVHRLDKDTSGVLLIAKNDRAHRYFANEIAQRRVYKEYLTLVFGRIKEMRGSVDSPIYRDIHDRKKMAVSTHPQARNALTHFEVANIFEKPTLTQLNVNIVTGRTHQIRVHLSSIGFPVVGDELYGNDTLNAQFFKDFPLQRIFLHAHKLGITLPNGKEELFTAPLANDLDTVLAMLNA